VAALWVAFIAHSHYDGVIEWALPEAKRPDALKRLQRLRGRPVWISHENSVQPTRKYLENTGVQAPFTFVRMPFPNHTDEWVLRDIAERAKVRAWVAGVLAQRNVDHHAGLQSQ